MFVNFRQSMAWVHTWFGLVLGFVLMVCFYFGALSVFDREIDRWAIPETRFEAQPMPSFDRALKPIFEGKVAPDAKGYADLMPLMHDAAKGPMTPRAELKPDVWWAYTTHRDPVLSMGGGFVIPHPKDPGNKHLWGDITIDPRDGRLLGEDALKIGSRWFYPMHYSLHFGWQSLGTYLVGFAALAMLAALVTGVVMHRKIFREFFTFRPWKRTQRSTLDLHNLTGVAGLPFHFFFAFTGLVIFAGTYFPIGHTMLKTLHDRGEVIEARETGLPHEAAGVAAPLASVDAMVAEAKRRWAARDMPGEVGFLRITHLGDRNGYVSVFRAGNDQVALVGQGVHFQASSGRVLREDPPPSAVMSVNEFLTGLHLQHFRHWTLRWLYVLGGLLGCVCIATGFIFFVEKRKQTHARDGLRGTRVVDALAVFTVTGMVIASIAMLVANRLLPAGMAERDHWQIAAFWGAWLLSLVHAAARGGVVQHARINPAWREQCWAIAALALAAVGLNGATTGDHLVRTLFQQTYWPVAGLDLSLLVVAAIALVAARRLAAREGRGEPATGRDATKKPAASQAPLQPASAKVRHG